MVAFHKAMFGGLMTGLLAIGACSMAPTMTDQGAMTASLSGSQEVPPSTGTGMGTMQARLNRQSGELRWTIAYSGLSGPVTAAHFHGPAKAGQNAGVQVPITGVLTSPMTGVAKLTGTQVDELMAGQWYVNLHTAANPNGELRGQVIAKP